MLAARSGVPVAIERGTDVKKALVVLAYLSAAAVGVLVGLWMAGSFLDSRTLVGGTDIASMSSGEITTAARAGQEISTETIVRLWFGQYRFQTSGQWLFLLTIIGFPIVFMGGVRWIRRHTKS